MQTADVSDCGQRRRLIDAIAIEIGLLVVLLGRRFQAGWRSHPQQIVIGLSTASLSLIVRNAAIRAIGTHTQIHTMAERERAVALFDKMVHANDVVYLCVLLWWIIWLWLDVINIHTYDIQSDTVGITRLIKHGDLAGMDLIIGPVYSSNLAIMTNYAGSLGIPVVSPVPLMNNSELNNHPNLFMANSSLEIAQNLITKNNEYYDHNIVFIHADISVLMRMLKDLKS